MKIGKILLGAAVGVGAIAAAPFTGGGSILAGVSAAASLAGTGTVVAAVGAAGAGAVIGAAVSDIQDDDDAERIRTAKETAFEDGLKKGEEITKKNIMPIIEDANKKYRYILALTAFGYAIAKCDGTISEEEEIELDYYLNLISKMQLPNSVLRQLATIKDSVCSFEDIVYYLDQVDYDYLHNFNELYENIALADNYINISEKEFGEKWKKYYESRV